MRSSTLEQAMIGVLLGERGLGPRVYVLGDDVSFEEFIDGRTLLVSISSSHTPAQLCDVM